MKLAIVGTGYVGLVTGTCFAEMGNEVVCVDIDARKIEKLNRGELPIFEPGLEIYYERNRREGRLHFTTSLEDALPESEVIFLALPTPPGEDGSADLSYVLGVADQIARWMAAHPETGYKIIVNKSTVPVGTADRVREIFESYGLKAGEQFDVVSNPEFLREGVAVDDFMKPERVIIGTRSPRAAEIMTQLYEPFVRQGNPILVMDERSSEMTKYAANAFLATKITFMNEIANVCERVGANVDEVRRGIGLDSRIGKQFLYAGIGFGGSCFPKDVKALAYMAQTHGMHPQLLTSVMEINEFQRRHVALKLHDLLGEIQGKTIGLLGLAFKENTDDIRESPALAIARHLLEQGAHVKAYDPEAMENSRRAVPEIEMCPDAYKVAENADALVVVTPWNEFKQLDMVRVRDSMKQPILVDGRNIYEPDTMKSLGFIYRGVGRGYDGNGIERSAAD